MLLRFQQLRLSLPSVGDSGSAPVAASPPVSVGTVSGGGAGDSWASLNRLTYTFRTSVPSKSASALATVWLRVTTVAPGGRSPRRTSELAQRTSTVCAEVSPAAIASTARSTQVRPPSIENCANGVPPP